MHKIKSTHTYSIPHCVVVNKVVEVIADDGLPAQSFEPVNKLTHDALETPPYRVFSLESQVAANQPIRRVSTCTLEPDELSQNQMNQVEAMYENYKAKEAERLKQKQEQEQQTN